MLGLFAARQDREQQSRQGQERADAGDSAVSPTIRRGTGRKFQWIGSGSFSDAAQTNAGRADAQLLAGAIHKSMNVFEVRVPTATPRIIGVADDVTIVRAFAAEITLQCHNATLPTLKDRKRML